MTSYSLKGKVAIITGGASGIGLATAKAFLNAGVLGITLADLSLEGLATTLASFTPEEQTRVLTVVTNVAKEEDTIEYVKQTVDKWGRLDISVQSAGIIHFRANVEDMDMAVYDRVMAVNVRGSFLGIKHSAKAMLASPGGGKGASIVLLTSTAGLDGIVQLAPYSATKSAIRGLALSTAAELGPLGIRVNSVAPGPTATPQLEWTPKEMWKDLASGSKMERLGKPEEVAEGILFLSSDDSSYITGSLLRVDGGTSNFA